MYTIDNSIIILKGAFFKQSGYIIITVHHTNWFKQSIISFQVNDNKINIKLQSNSLNIHWLQLILSFFPEYFSYFLQSTYSLSDSTHWFALDYKYNRICEFIQEFTTHTYITTKIGCTSTIRTSLATKDFSKTVWTDILCKWNKNIKQHLKHWLNFTCWASIISFAITWIFNLFGLIRLLICLNLAGIRNATIIIMI
jgi:hypothetical protein